MPPKAARQRPAGSVVARLGGEEFAVLLAQAPDSACGTEPEAGLDVMRQRLADLPLIVPGGVVRMTASFAWPCPCLAKRWTAC
jgi:GGDEF domain-containing protein